MFLYIYSLNHYQPSVLLYIHILIPISIYFRHPSITTPCLGRRPFTRAHVRAQNSARVHWSGQAAHHTNAFQQRLQVCDDFNDKKVHGSN